jgi:hypothetical protein
MLDDSGPFTVARTTLLDDCFFRTVIPTRHGDSGDRAAVAYFVIFGLHSKQVSFRRQEFDALCMDIGLRAENEACKNHSGAHYEREP